MLHLEHCDYQHTLLSLLEYLIGQSIQILVLTLLVSSCVILPSTLTSQDCSFQLKIRV